ncbi:pantetheine-phosphate adenylyltransferase [Christensenella timonensis]|uniref:pantetheine-phosphate adenylyltransferase n=1 Tax=Christensenella timonensis TaxID=1816678 RepID=UPI00082EA225|nr:pantetheine-phosphate adenylyltransferase [Christensenella timonensis]
MEACVYPGSFDPITKGHLDIIERAGVIFSTVYVGVLNNISKRCMFSVEKRVEMVKAATRHIKNIQVVSFDGLLVDLLKTLDARVIIRGLRTGTDLELEQQYAFINGKLLEGTETLALLSRPETHYISSTAVRELLAFHADVSDYVPEAILSMIDKGE